MIDAFGVVYCLCVMIVFVSIVLMTIIDIVEHFQYKREFKVIERLAELEERKNENHA